MLKEYIDKNNVSMYMLSKNTGIPYSTLNDICNGKVDIDNCKVSIINKLAKYFNISMDQVYEICINHKDIIHMDMINDNVYKYVKNKDYYVNFKYEGKDVNIRVCKVTKINDEYIDAMAKWKVEDYIRDIEMEKLYDLQFNAKR